MASVLLALTALSVVGVPVGLVLASLEGPRLRAVGLWVSGLRISIDKLGRVRRRSASYGSRPPQNLDHGAHALPPPGPPGGRRPPVNPAAAGGV